MATEKQCEANRKNALLSTGPKTPEGKAIVRLNALKHGLRADSFEVAPGEDPAEFASRLDGWNRTYAPANPVEANLVRQAVVISWQIDRAIRFENSALSRRVRDAVMACDCDDDDVEALTAASGLAFFDASKEGDKLRRYQFALQRDMHRAIADLAKLQGSTSARNPNESFGANEANFVGPTLLSDVRESQTHTSQPVAIPSVEALSRECPVPEAPAPNKANLEVADHEIGVPSDPGDASRERRSPDRLADTEPDYTPPTRAIKANSVAPNKAISARGKRELEQFFADQDRREAHDDSWLDISIEKR